jgi:hypothetical protein
MPDGPGWRATWTVNLDAEREYPPDTHGTLLEIAAPPASVVLAHAEVRHDDGTLLADTTTAVASIGASNGGSAALVAGGPLLQVEQEVSYVTTATPPSQSRLNVVVTLRDARGLEHRLTTTSLVGEALCGGRGLPPCEAAP